MTVLDQRQIEELRQFDTPTVYNAIDSLHVRPATSGFTRPGLTLNSPLEKPMVGYAVTAKVAAWAPGENAARKLVEYYDTVLASPGPSVAVIEDIDDEPIGSFWGEVQATTHLALGCVGTLTQGGVRDLNEAGPLGFYFFSTQVMVARGNTHIEEYGCPVTVCGLTIRPGDLIHADCHGAVIIPGEIAGQVADACRGMQKAELAVLEPCREAIRKGERPTAQQVGEWRRQMSQKR